MLNSGFLPQKNVYNKKNKISEKRKFITKCEQKLRRPKIAKPLLKTRFLFQTGFSFDFNVTIECVKNA